MAEPAHERRPTSRLSVAAGVMALVLLTALSLLIYERARTELVERAESQVRDAAAFGALLVDEQTRRYTELATSRAKTLAITDGPLNRLTPGQRARVDRELAEIRASSSGLLFAALHSPDGVLLASSPPFPELYGRSFAFRDWYRGVTRERTPYVSRVFRAVTPDRDKTVSVAALIGPAEEPVAILNLSLAGLSQGRFSVTQDVGVVVTDQAGDVVGASGVDTDRIDSRRDDPFVGAALDGRSGTITADGEIVSYAPVRRTGWTVSARLSEDDALADVGDLRAVALLLTTIIGLLVAALTTAAILFQRRAAGLQAAAAQRRQAFHLHDGVVQSLVVAQAARRAGDDATADRAVADALAESKQITADLLPDDLTPGDLARPEG